MIINTEKIPMHFRKLMESYGIEMNSCHGYDLKNLH